MKKAFTLIELLVVISIIGVLATLIINNLNDARARARDSRRKSDLGQLKTGLRLYYNDHQAYPGDGGVPASGSFTEGDTIYMKQLPEEFTYDQIDNDNFTLKVTLENASDPGLIPSQTACPGSDAATDYVVCSD